MRKTLLRVMQHFYWPGVYADVSRFCRSCDICQRSSIGKPPKVPLINLPVISTPFERVAIDLIGPLTKSRKGNRFALVSIDLATKYPDAVPLKRIDSETIAEALLEIYSRVGLPKEILHDQGTQFMSAVMRKFNQLLQIKSIHTTPYNPRCNGSVENFNKSLKQMLKKMTEEQPEDWDRYLQPLLFAYREVPQLSTGFAPFELLFGHEVRGPLFLIKEKILSNMTDEEELSVTSYVMQMRQRVKEFMELANITEERSKKKEKFYYDRTCRKRTFKVGDEVLLLLPTSTNKLQAEWKGPFVVVRRLNKVDYVIRVGSNERTYHINMLKPFRTREVPSQAGRMEVSQLADTTVGLEPKISKELTTEQKKQMETLLETEKAVFSSVPGQIAGLKYRISVNTEKPIRMLPYKVPFHLKNQVKEELEKWLRQGIIRKSTSEWASPMVVMRNADDSLRLAIDFRKLNPHVNVDNYPMPERESVIEQLFDAKFLSKLDLTKAYFQMPLEENSKQYTSFVTEFGQFEFNCVPFGIRFASGLCNRVLKEILADCSDFVTSFVDDLVIFSSDFESHVVHVQTVMRKLKAAGITLNIAKCDFGQTRVKFLGFIVGSGEIKPDPAKVEAVRQFPKPGRKKELRSFLGLLNFYRRFLPHLSHHIAGLTKMLCKSELDVL
ncbi:uncharacterized protein LOC125179399 [Hyalella azteca]|uniref:RNA-directed DNA polymerase n=1 Tax=Hyalella azteca TaxID=294128 RepID=A0A979FXC8_HYAAZ|nr:uncharacterized protein LOC125179399 [Hyalella azteca]